MTAPSQTPEAAGLEVVAWRVVDYEGLERGLFYSDDVARETTASDDTITPLVTAASAQAAIDAEKARADRLAKALEPFAVPHECDGHATVEDFNMEVQIFVRWSVIKAARAALQQEG